MSIIQAPVVAAAPNATQSAQVHNEPIHRTSWTKKVKDCHTCAALRRVCDRQRPQCNTCLDLGEECAGFAIPLSWNTSRMWLGKSNSENIRKASNDKSDITDYDLHGSSCPTGPKPKKDRKYKFVLGPSRKRRKVVEADDRPQVNQHNQHRCSNQSDFADEHSQHMFYDNVADGSVPMTVDELLLDDLAFNSSTAGSDMFLDSLDIGSAESNHDVHVNSTEQHQQHDLSEPLDPLDSLDPGIDIGLSDLEGALLSPIATPALLEDDLISISNIHRPQDATPRGQVSFEPLDFETQEAALPPTPFPVAGHRYDALLKMYDSEFCILPLTSDMKINPFRIRKPVSFTTPNLLAHSILALSCQHLNHYTGIWATEAIEHRSRADQLLDVALRDRQNKQLGLDVLDAILIMITQDCTLSALGAWNVHLSRALTVLNAAGGISVLENPRVQSQVAMLIWWDATLALVSRQGLVFDRCYLERLLQLEKKCMWSFYEISGCPGEMLRCLVELADLAKQADIAASMTWLTFDLTPVRAIETRLQAMNCQALVEEEREVIEEELTVAEQEERYHTLKDRVHCVESWRHALFLYIERVFKWDRQSSRPTSLVPLGRSLMDCVTCCRRTSQTQKQMLLPVFLAGSETVNEDMRQIVRDYCGYWGQRSRYYMFYSVSSLLEEVWTTIKDGPPTVWWGQVIDRKPKASLTGHSLPGQGGLQFLFG